jgi:chromosome segregation ATPase
MEKLQKEMNELKNLNNSLKEELEGVNRELQESIASKLQIESQLKESCKLQKSLKIANEKLTGVAKEYEDLKLEMHGFSKKYNKTLEELEFYKLSSQMAESRLKKYINEIAGKEVEKREMQNKMKDVEFTLNEELNGLRKEVKESKEVITQRELEATVREAKERIEQLEEKLIDKEQLIESVTIGRNNIEVQFKQMLKKVDDIEREKKSLLTRAMESEKLFKVLKGNEKSHKHKLADERHNDGDQQIISKLRMKVEKYEEEKKIANSRMLQLKSIIDELSLARELSEEKERSSKEAKEILEKNITTLQLSLDAEYMGHSLTCENYEDLNEKFEHLKQEIVETCAERDKLKFQLDEALKQLKETENLVKKMKESSEMMSAASKKNIELTSKVRELERKLLSEDTTHHKEYAQFICFQLCFELYYIILKISVVKRRTCKRIGNVKN